MKLSTKQKKTRLNAYRYWIKKGCTDNDANELTYRDLIEKYPELNTTEGRNAHGGD